MVQFPYALKSLPAVLESEWDKPEFQRYKHAFPTDARATPEILLNHVHDLTARDVKVPYLKELQGYLWHIGYTKGDIVTPLYPDVVPQLQHWKTSEVSLAIYSSGSVAAQQDIFKHTGGNVVQDVTGLISHWFDANTAGPKLKSQSYANICKSLGHDAKEVLFLTDNVQEIAAASQAGLHVMVVDRPGNAPLSEEDRRLCRVITSLDQANLSPA